MIIGTWNWQIADYILRMRSHLLVAVMLACLIAGCGRKQSQPPSDKNTNSTVGNPLTAPADYAGAVVRSKNVAEKVVDVASLKQAIQMFYASEDRYPQDLNELVKSGYMPALPKPPTGMKFQYDKTRGDVRLVPAQ